MSQEKVREILREVWDLEGIILKAQADLKGRVKRMQELCTHPREFLVDAKYESGEFSTQRPFRVCRECGYAEEGWGSGYWKLHPNLRDEIPELSRQIAYKLVRTFVDQEEQWKIRRGEK